MTNDQKVALGLLKEAIMAPRKERRIKLIKERLQKLEKTLESVSLWKRILRRLKR